ncbi:MAG: hypothetical protein JF595_06125 [Sphingomonadales bacterium]|nr:hypothetical protein [Sphingomonadales bacterium]
MQAMRALTHRHRLLALLLVVASLVIKAAVPAGYMLGQQGTVLTIAICADALGGASTKQVVILPAGAPEDAKGAHDKAPTTCPYAALGFASLMGADAALLALALAFIVAFGLAPAPPAPLRRIAFLRPPLRGPPAHT